MLAKDPSSTADSYRVNTSRGHPNVGQNVAPEVDVAATGNSTTTAAATAVAM